MMRAVICRYVSNRDFPSTYKSSSDSLAAFSRRIHSSVAGSVTRKYTFWARLIAVIVSSVACAPSLMPVPTTTSDPADRPLFCSGIGCSPPRLAGLPRLGPAFRARAVARHGGALGKPLDLTVGQRHL